MKQMILLISLLMTLKSAGAPWVPPIGIPEPAFGIKEQAPPQPAAWPGAESVGSYYIDNTHPSATDSANNYGYPARPRQTIPKKLAVTAGSVTEIHGGPYLKGTTDYVWYIDSSTTSPPTAEAPAFISGIGSPVLGISQVAVDAQTPARIEMGRTFLQYTIIEGLHFDKISANFMGLDVHHVSIRNCESKNGGPRFSVCPFQGGTIHDVVFYNNLIHDTLYWDDIANDWDFHGIVVNTYGRQAPTTLYNVWVVDNTFYHCSGDSVQVNGNSAGHEALHHVYIGRNTAHSNRQSGFWCKQASHVIISQNTIWNMQEHGSQPGNGIGFQYGPDNLWIIYNEIYGSEFGIRQSDTGAGFEDHNAYFVGNYIHDLTQNSIRQHYGYPTGWGIALWSGVLTRHIVDNTIKKAFGGIFVRSYGPTHLNGNIVSSLVPNNVTGYGMYLPHLAVVNPGSAGSVTVDNSLFYNGADGISIKWASATFNTLSAFRSATSEGDGCLTSNPSFDTISNDGRLLASSPAVDTSAESDVYATFKNLYGIDIRMDRQGGSRPVGTAWDIGAHEYRPVGPQDPAIEAQPTSQTIAVGAVATFTVRASGSGTLRYQWQKNGVNIDGAQSASFATSPSTLADSGTAYRCEVSNEVGRATSTPAILTVSSSKPDKPRGFGVEVLPR